MEYLIELIGEKAQHLFVTKQLMCSEAVLTVLNRSLSGGLGPGVDIQLASGLSEGIGGRGCSCGALTGGVLSLGLFLGREKPGFMNNKIIMNASKELHDCFKKKYNSTCCRILSKNLKHGSKDHYKKGSEIVRFSSEQTGRILLRENPKLILSADYIYLEQLDSGIKSVLKKLSNSFT
jgi:C_GCAxxG_C_C family probable redox protein